MHLIPKASRLLGLVMPGIRLKILELRIERIMNKTDKEILEEFVVENRDLDKLESLLAEFNIFEAIGAVRQELRHSDFLSFLMNPFQNHGLSDIFLKRLLKKALLKAVEQSLSPIDIDVMDLTDSEIRREWRNIDILIHSPSNKLVCAVENKFMSKEHSQQLQRYQQIIQNEFPHHIDILIYLTPEADNPSDVNWIPFSYVEVLNVIDTICQSYKSTIGGDVYTLMTHYLTMLRRHIVSGSDVGELAEKIYRSHKRALDIIFEHRPDLQSDLSDFLQDLVSREKEEGLLPDLSSKGLIRFVVKEWDTIFPKGKGWTPSGRILLFEFQNYSDFLTLKLIIGPGPQEIRQKVHQCALNNQSIFKGLSKKLYQKWTQIYKKEIFKVKDFEDTDSQILLSRLEKKWNDFLKDELPVIKQCVLSEFGS